jgi:hypothetical protein
LQPRTHSAACAQGDADSEVHHDNVCSLVFITGAEALAGAGALNKEIKSSPYCCAPRGTRHSGHESSDATAATPRVLNPPPTSRLESLLIVRGRGVGAGVKDLAASQIDGLVDGLPVPQTKELQRESSTSPRAAQASRARRLHCKGRRCTKALAKPGHTLPGPRCPVAH